MSEHLLENGRILEGSQEAHASGKGGMVVVDLIREGFGNPRDNHYYSRDVLQEAVDRFNGRKMYANHLAPEAQKRLSGMPRDIQDVMGRIREAWLDSDEGTGRAVVRGKVSISQPWLWNMVEHDPELLGVSLNARGNSRVGIVEGKQAKIVEGIADINSVDWVTEAGAGGRVVSLMEAQMAEDEGAEGAETQDETSGQQADDAGASSAQGADEQSGAEDSQGSEGEQAGDDAPAGDAQSEDAASDDEGADDDEGWEPVEDPDAEADGDLGEGDLDDEKDGYEDRATAELRSEAAERGIAEAEDLGRPELIDGLREQDAQDDVAAEDDGEDDEDDDEGTAASGEDDESQQEAARGRRGGRRSAARHPRVPGRASAGELARQLEAEIEKRTGERVHDAVDAALDAAEARFTEHLAEVEQRHARALAQVEQRYQAREIIFAEAKGLPQPSQQALLAEVYDIFVEAAGDDDEAKSADAELREAVVKLIDDKKAELRGFQEARITGAGETASMVEGGGPERTEREESAERRKSAPLDEELDRELGIEREEQAA